jgi:hypothetical protein
MLSAKQGGVVKVTRVKPGEVPDTADCIRIDRLAPDKFAWMGSIDIGGSAAFGYSPNDFRSADEAEANAVAWAAGHGATEILVEVCNA